MPSKPAQDTRLRAAVMLSAFLVSAALAGGAAEPKETPNVTTTDTATFAAGCFWGVQAAFDKLPGVVSTTVGYTGGHTEKPTYEDVCSDETGHAEAVEIVFDPAKVSYQQLLDTFWAIHDPTTPDRQGPDIGSQYRSAIFYHSPAQESAARASKARLEKSGRLKRPVVTEIVPAATFWRAEEYHQEYFRKHGGGTCHIR